MVTLIKFGNTNTFFIRVENGGQLVDTDMRELCLHFSDRIFEREKRLCYELICEAEANVITCANIRNFLEKFGFSGEIFSVKSRMRTVLRFFRKAANLWRTTSNLLNILRLIKEIFSSKTTGNTL